MKSRKNTLLSAVRLTPCIREGSKDDFEQLRRRKLDDPMQLYPRVLDRLDHYFLIRDLTYLSGQREMMGNAVDSILQANTGSVTAIPFQPGLGKSTLIRALLDVFSEKFQQQTPIAQKLGGIIVVVEKTAEADELENLCNQQQADRPIAKAISSANDYNLAQGKCFNGRASSYAECLGRICPEYTECSLMQSAHQTHETPILIILHARYQRHMEDMTPFLSWEDAEGHSYSRTLLLVDELPPLVEDNALDISILNKIETLLSQLRPSYQTQYRIEKATLLFEWNRCIRTPFFKLMNVIRRKPGLYGIVYPEDFDYAGFSPKKLQKLRGNIINYVGAPTCDAVRIIDAVLSGNNAYFAVGQDTALFFPRLRKLNGEGQPATVIFSGTASLSPELSRNPDIKTLPDRNLESFQRLQVNIQRSDLFNSSKTGLTRKQNQAAMTAWLCSMLSRLSERHKRILVVTYKGYAELLWNSVSEYHEVLIPYIGSDGQGKPLLPYFGGLNGSNQYRESTCVICLGLNRFEPRDYISRALALDFDGSCQWHLAYGHRH